MTTSKVGSKIKISFLEPIWQVGPILPSALVDIVDSGGRVEDTTFEAKTNNIKKFEAKYGLIKDILSKPRAGMVRDQG